MVNKDSFWKYFRLYSASASLKTAGLFGGIMGIRQLDDPNYGVEAKYLAISCALIYLFGDIIGKLTNETSRVKNINNLEKSLKE